MSANKNKPHLLVVPEDEANRQIANGFVLEFGLPRQLTVERPAGGWLFVLDKFEKDHLPAMDRVPHRSVLLLIDFDNHPDRREEATRRIPEHMRHRVFILGVLTEPERLRGGVGQSYEEIGAELAQECRDGTAYLWNHDLLRHNSPELDRMRTLLQPILFSN